MAKEITDEELAAAEARFVELRRTKPFARTARYDAKAGRIVVELTNGASFAFPPQLLQDMEHGTPEQFAEVEVIGDGYGLHWESLDADFTVPGLLNGVFGTAKWMAQQAGKTKSPAKAAAARANGAKGGRPKKVAA
jgi:hypothetical protein